MKRIAGSKPGELGTDTSRDYVYTEWDGVRRFTEDFLDGLCPTRAPADRPAQGRPTARVTTAATSVDAFAVRSEVRKLDCTQAPASLESRRR